MLCLIIVPVAANYNFNGFPMETRASDTINGGVFIDYEPWDGTRALTGNFDVPNGDIGHVYTPVYGEARKITKVG